MSEWWSYRPQDLLLFSSRVYWRLFELHNAAFWPLHLAMLAIGFGLIFIALYRPRTGAPWIAITLAALWAFVAWSFLWRRYATINWAMIYVAPAFGIQALMLAIGGLWRGALAFDRNDVAGRIGLLLALLGVVAYPLLPLLFGRPWSNTEMFGLAPDPTVIVTLGILLTARGGFTLLLLAIPILWLLLSGLTLRTMGDLQAWIPFSAAVIVAAALAQQRLGLRKPD
jgi:hypothetical protein